MDKIELNNINWDYLITEGTNIKIKIWYLEFGNYLKSKIVIKSISVDCNTFWYYTIGRCDLILIDIAQITAPNRFNNLVSK